MKARIPFSLCLFVLAAPAAAQAANLKQELRTKESAASGCGALFQVAKWANEKGTVVDASASTRQCSLKPDHQTPTCDWQPTRRGQVAPARKPKPRKKAMAVEYAQRFVQAGVWPKDKVDDATA